MRDPDWATWPLFFYEVRDELTYRPVFFCVFFFLVGAVVGALL